MRVRLGTVDDGPPLKAQRRTREEPTGAKAGQIIRITSFGMASM